MMVSLQDGDKTYLQVELIEGREKLSDCTNAFVRYVDAVSHLQTTMMTIAITMVMKMVTKMMTMMMM